MFGRTSALVDSTSEDTEAKQLEDFNSSLESYNKKLMYGTEIITVINKAVDNNKRYGVESDTSSKYYVDIVFRLKKDVDETIEEYKRQPDMTYEHTDTRTGSKRYF